MSASPGAWNSSHLSSSVTPGDAGRGGYSFSPFFFHFPVANAFGSCGDARTLGGERVHVNSKSHKSGQ